MVSHRTRADAGTRRHPSGPCAPRQRADTLQGMSARGRLGPPMSISRRRRPARQPASSRAAVPLRQCSRRGRKSGRNSRQPKALTMATFDFQLERELRRPDLRSRKTGFFSSLRRTASGPSRRAAIKRRESKQIWIAGYFVLRASGDTQNLICIGPFDTIPTMLWAAGGVLRLFRRVEGSRGGAERLNVESDLERSNPNPAAPAIPTRRISAIFQALSTRSGRSSARNHLRPADAAVAPMRVTVAQVERMLYVKVIDSRGRQNFSPPRSFPAALGRHRA